MKVNTFWKKIHVARCHRGYRSFHSTAQMETVLAFPLSEISFNSRLDTHRIIDRIVTPPEKSKKWLTTNSSRLVPLKWWLLYSIVCQAGEKNCAKNSSGNLKKFVPVFCLFPCELEHFTRIMHRVVFMPNVFCYFSATPRPRSGWKRPSWRALSRVRGGLWRDWRSSGNPQMPSLRKGLRTARKAAIWGAHWQMHYINVRGLIVFIYRCVK